MSGALFNGEDGKCGVTVQVMVLPKWASQPITCTDETWQLAIDQAAYEVCAFILPLTRLVDKPPWPAWRRLAIPTQLFRDVQEAQHCKASRCFDEALKKYYETLKLDPHNPYLRLELGMLQEQIGLYLDAVVTYEDIIQLAPAGLDLKIYHPFKRKPVYFHRIGISIRRDWWRVPLLMARFRQAVLLGMGERLSEEWSPQDEIGGQRAKECTNLRTRFQEVFGGYFEDFCQYIIDHEGQPDDQGYMRSGHFLPTHSGGILPQGSLGTPQEKLLQREFFQFVGQFRAQQLSRAYFFPRVIPGRKIPRASLRLLLVWNPVRRCWTRSLRHEGKPDFLGLKYLSAHRAAERATILKNGWKVIRRFEFMSGPAKMSWPIKASDLSRRVLYGRHGMRLSPLLPHWQDFYDAACIYAACILPSEGGVADAGAKPSRSYFSLPLEANGRATRKRVDKLAEKAVENLESSSQLQDSGFASSIRPWILADDPDLVGLRRRREFTRWADQHFPTKNLNRVRPDNVHEIELIYYEQLLIKKSAATAAAVWSRRSTQVSNGSLRPAKLREWLDKEELGWDLVAEFVQNRRHWQTRYKTIQAMREFGRDSSESNMIYEFRGVYPTYSADPVIDLPNSDDSDFTKKVESAQERRNQRIIDLEKILQSRQEWCLAGAPKLPCQREVLLQFCAQLAARWDTLAEAFHEKIISGELITLVPVQNVGRKPEDFNVGTPGQPGATGEG
ncbi:hypothetical protein AB0945_36285 [Streptomyces sp. NPDC005474]|uniref:hypothetical protein n=1 Tax=Streptomyces sp. NPDC005474 TaxID=3154878 RepID=UPI0034560381